eukprot:TRINITY_DN6154_c0_g1_i2.p1 TRINITY_DN6154_c0_g1~~TRINITY_DN6154_c0_g1_i2.p1  ORF type:complete len:476 (-),score=36.82 TRINITY_DN6154_c0_g1_i2:308-1735(-)
MFYLLVSVLFTSSCFRCAVALEVTSDYAFEKYKQDFRRSYAVGSDEHDARRVIFEQRLEDVISHNARNSSWKKGMNHLSDLSAAELKARYGYRRGPSRFASPASSVRQSSSMLELDSSDSSCSGQLSSCTNSDSQCCKGLICGAAGACVKKARRLESFEWTPKLSTAYDVLEQGQCGSCWAVAAAAVIQFQAELTSGYKEVLSPQSMLSCSPNEHECGGQGGCKGATAELAFEYAKTHSKNGVLSLEQQDYTAEETPDACSSDQLSFLERKRHPGVSIKGWRKIKENDAHVMMSTLAQVGPLAASIAAGSGLHAYSSGIIPHADTDFVLNHAVVMMGYGKDESLGNMLYWNIRNSWGPDWGESGFFRLERFAPERQEPCGWDMEPEKGVVCKDLRHILSIYSFSITVCTREMFATGVRNMPRIRTPTEITRQSSGYAALLGFSPTRHMLSAHPCLKNQHPRVVRGVWCARTRVPS